MFQIGLRRFLHKNACVIRFLCTNFSVECVYASRYHLNVYLDLRGKVVKTKKLLKFITNTLTNSSIIYLYTYIYTCICVFVYIYVYI